MLLLSDLLLLLSEMADRAEEDEKPIEQPVPRIVLEPWTFTDALEAFRVGLNSPDG